MERIDEFLSITGLDIEVGQKYLTRFSTFDEALDIYLDKVHYILRTKTFIDMFYT